MNLEFLKPARIDEVLEVETRLKEVGAAHLVLLQTIRRDDTPLLEADVMVVLVSVSGKPLRLNPRIRAAFAGLEAQASG
jgi:acyl-CoA thioester hydrolase